MSALARPSTRVIIMVWKMKGCGHCEEYAPRFRKIVSEYGTIFRQRHVQVLELDAAAPELQALADHFGISATPTTIAAARSGGQLRLDGAESDAKIRALCDAVANA